MDNKETFGGMFQSLKAIALHIFLSSAWTSSATSSLSGLIYLILIIIKMSRPLWHFDMLFSATKLERTGSGYKCVWQFTFTQIYHYHQCLNVSKAVRRPLGVKWAIKRAESHCSSTTMIGGAAFHENLTWSVSIPFFLVKNVLKA